ncbi:MAG: hypothetical protein HY720_32430 [Planctomycetes bacterium]|nr:hypothetical protein [Planctomycetota bacterium]
MRNLLACPAVVLALAACQGNGKPEEESVEGTGILEAATVATGNSPLAVLVSPAGEPLVAGAGLPPLSRDGALDVEIALANRGDETLEGIAIALVTEKGDAGVGSGVLRVDALAPGEARTVSGRFTVSGTVGPAAVAVLFRRGGAQERVLVPAGAALPGVRLDTLAVPGEEGLNGRAGRLLDRPVARGVGYDLLVGKGEQILVQAVLSGTEARLAVACEAFLVPKGGVRVDPGALPSGTTSDGRRIVRFLLDASRADVGKADFDLVVRSLAAGKVSERSWRLGVGVYEIASMEDSDSLRFSFLLPSGARGEWTGPARLGPRDAPRDLDAALALVDGRAREDLAKAIAASRIAFTPPAGPGLDRAALRGEVAAAIGGSAGYGLLRTQVRADLFEGLPEEPALARALAAKAGDVGYLWGPLILAAALSDWNAAEGTVSLEGARWPEGPRIEFDRDRFAALVTRVPAALRSARWGAGAPVPLEGVPEIAPDAMPFSVTYDVSAVEDSSSAAYELLLSAASGVSVAVQARAEAGSVEFYLERIPPGDFRAKLLARWPGGRVGTGPSLAVRVVAPPPADGKEVPDDLLEILSPSEREKMRTGGTFAKSVAVEKDGRFSLVVRQVTLERGRVLESKDVSFELVSAKYDEVTKQSTVQVRMVASETKIWNLSLAPGGGPAAPGSMPAPLRQVSVRLEKETPQLVSFSMPGRFGDSFTLLEHSISGSPAASLGGFLASDVSLYQVAIQSETTPRNFSAVLARQVPTARRWARFDSAIQPGLLSGVFLLDRDEAGPGSGDLQSIPLDKFVAAGGEVRMVGTGGPGLRVEVTNIPEGMDPNVQLTVPAGTCLGGGVGVQRLVLPGNVSVPLDGTGSHDVTALCLEEGKPFPGVDDPLQAGGFLDVPGGAFASRVTSFLATGAYPGLEGLPLPVEQRGRMASELAQMMLWAYKNLSAGGGSPDYDEARRVAFGTARDTLGQSPEWSGLSGEDRENVARAAADAFQDAWFGTNGGGASPAGGVPLE